MKLDELLKNLGVTDEEKAKEAINAFLDGQYVPKSRFNEINEEKKTLTATVKDRDKQLEDLKKTAGNTDELQSKIKTLQEENKAAAKKFEEDMKSYRIDTAIKLAIANDAQDVDIVAGLIKRDSLVLAEDGKLSGLSEQVEALKKEKAFLFKTETKPPYVPHGGSQGNAANPFTPEGWNVTKQGELFKTNPEQARALAAAAGKTI